MALCDSREFLVYTLLALLFVGLQGCAARAKAIPVEGQTHVNSSSPTDKVCLLQGDLPYAVNYTILAQIKGSKRSYGSTDSVLNAMAQEAKRIGADAVINISAKQGFGGFMPWSHVRPKGTGAAIKLKTDQKPIDCVALGGKQY